MTSDLCEPYAVEQVVIYPETCAVIVIWFGDRPFWSCLLFFGVVGHVERKSRSDFDADYLGNVNCG